MNRKKVILLFVSLIFISSLFSGVASAQEDFFLPDIIQGWAKFFFIDLSNLAKSSENAFIIYAKFLFFFLVFAVLYWGTSKIPGMDEKRRISITITFIIALISTVMIPAQLIKFIYETYSAVIGFVFALMPFFVGFILGNKVFAGNERWKRIFRGIIYVIMLVVTLALIGTIEEFDDPIYLELAKWMQVAVFILFIAAAASLLGGFGKGKEGEDDAGGIGGTSRRDGTGGADGEGGTKTPREQKLTAKAANKVSQLTSQMSVIEERLARLEAIEQEEYYNKLGHYEHQLKLLEEVDNILAGSWNILSNLRSIVSGMKSNPQRYEESREDIEGSLSTYYKFVQKLYDVLNGLAREVGNQMKSDRHLEMLDDNYKKMIQYLKEIDNLDEDIARRILNKFHKRKVKALGSLRAPELTQLRNLVIAIKALKTTFNSVTDVLKHDATLDDNLKKEDQKDHDKIKSIIDRMSGLINNYRAAYRSYKTGGKWIPSAYALIAKFLLPTGNIGVFARDIRLIRQNTINKINMIKNHEKLMSTKRGLGKKVVDLTSYIRQIDQILVIGA